MADTKVSGLTAQTGPNLVGSDLLYVVDVGASPESRKVTVQEFFNSIETVLTTALTGAASATGDLFIVADVDANAAKSMTRAELANAIIAEVQQSNIAALTDSSGGSADGTIAAISGSGADSDINNNFADLAAKVNAILTALDGAGITA